MRISISGPGEAGKDEVGHWFGKNTPLRYVRSTSEFASEIVFKEWGFAFYPTAFACWLDRRNHREFWKQKISEYNKDNPVQLYIDCLADQDILVGIRSRNEFEAVRAAGLVDLSIWIERDCPFDSTIEFGPDDCDLVVPNNGTVLELYKRLDRFWSFVKEGAK